MTALNSKELLNIAIKNGWIIKNQRGSHIKLIHTEFDKHIIIPYHGAKEIPKGTLNIILKQMGLKE